MKKRKKKEKKSFFAIIILSELWDSSWHQGVLRSKTKESLHKNLAKLDKYCFKMINKQPLDQEMNKRIMSQLINNLV